MSLDREDVLSNTSAATAPTPAVVLAPAAWFSAPPQAVPVVIKKRRLTRLSGSAADGAAPAAPADERRPRVFVLPRETPSEAPREPAAPLTPDAASLPATAGPRRLRRREPWRRPSPVVHIVPEPSTDPMPADEGSAVGPDALVQPALLAGYREVQAALAQVRRLLEQAERARRVALSLAAPRRA